MNGKEITKKDKNKRKPIRYAQRKKNPRRKNGTEDEQSMMR